MQRGTGGIVHAPSHPVPLKTRCSGRIEDLETTENLIAPRAADATTTREGFRDGKPPMVIRLAAAAAHVYLNPRACAGPFPCTGSWAEGRRARRCHEGEPEERLRAVPAKTSG